MCRSLSFAGLATASVVLMACAEQPAAAVTEKANYQGIETILLDGDLVNFRVAMKNARDISDVEAYARCAAAQYTLIRGFGFARHVRTNVAHSGNQWLGDAVYTISAGLPQGVRTIDAEVTVRDCGELGIPTV